PSPLLLRLHDKREKIAAGRRRQERRNWVRGFCGMGQVQPTDNDLAAELSQVVGSAQTRNVDTDSEDSAPEHDMDGEGEEEEDLDPGLASE
ncbi:unnamed protein product, partial [Discosporangium mesarthrocarpum]